jgi:hypothetical protein
MSSLLELHAKCRNEVVEGNVSAICNTAPERCGFRSKYRELCSSKRFAVLIDQVALCPFDVTE